MRGAGPCNAGETRIDPMVRADIPGTGPRVGLVEADPGCGELAGCVQLVEPESAGLTKEPIVTPPKIATPSSTIVNGDGVKPGLTSAVGWI